MVWYLGLIYVSPLNFVQKRYNTVNFVNPFSNPTACNPITDETPVKKRVRLFYRY